MRHRILQALTLALALALVVPTAAIAQPSTDIWLGRLDLRGGGVAITELVNITQRPGYDNQPAFFPDQPTLAYTTQRDGGTHAMLYDLATGTARPVPAARGFSPTPTDDGRQLMMTFAGQVVLHDLDGTRLRALTDSVRVGYYTRVDARTFVAEAPFSSDSAVAARIDPASVRLELRKLDLDRRRVETLAVIPFPTPGQHAWTPRKTLLIGSGNRILEWSPAAPGTWTPVATFAEPGLQQISRIAISPRGDRIAIVSATKE
jgi:hypothetical protein